MTNDLQKALSNQTPLLHGRGLGSVSCFLFDMDGVLYNSMPNHAIAWVRCMKQFGIHFTAEDAYTTEGARGVDTIRAFAKKQLNKELTEDEAQKIYDVKTKYFHELPTAEVFDGVTDLMRLLKSKGIAVGVVTGSGQRPLIDRLLNDFGEFVDEQHIVTAYDVKRGKPNPDPYIMGLKKCGNMKPSEAVVIENAPLGVRAGVAAGCFTVAINSGSLPDSALLAEHPSLLFKSVREFYNNIKE